MESSKSPDADRSPHRFTLDALARVLRETLRLTPQDPLYVAYSGGMDSHVLLHALASLRRQDPWHVHAIHVDHGLHPQSAHWARHCAAVCADLNVPYQTERVRVTDIAARGLEDAARAARYAALARLLPPGAVLLTAHHQNDQAETLLLQLLRGAGPAGLAAMPAAAAFAAGRIARPLLGFERAALAAYAADHRLRWIEDTSNSDTRLARNFLRRRVWPVLAERWPQAAGRLAAAARHQAEAAQLLDALGRLDLEACGDTEGALRISAVQALAPARRANLIRYWIRQAGARVPPEPVLRQILACVARTPQTRHAAVRWPGAQVCRYRDRLALLGGAAAAAAGWEAPWEPSGVLEIPGGLWRLRAVPTVGAGIACARVAGKTLRVRLRRGGERCRLRGHRRKVKKLLQEAGIPPWERRLLPFVYLDDELVAVGDRWVCEPFAAGRDEPGFVLVLEPRPLALV